MMVSDYQVVAQPNEYSHLSYISNIVISTYVGGRHFLLYLIPSGMVIFLAATSPSSIIFISGKSASKLEAVNSRFTKELSSRY